MKAWTTWYQALAEPAEAKGVTGDSVTQNGESV